MSSQSLLDKYAITLSKIFKEKYETAYQNEVNTKNKIEEHWNNIIWNKLYEIGVKVEKGDLEISTLEFHDDLIEYIKNYKTPNENVKKRASIQQAYYILSFIYPIITKLEKKPRDQYAFCCGFDSYKDFKTKFDNNEIEIEEENNIKNKAKTEVIISEDIEKESLSLIEKEDILKDFFKNPCYIYAYDEDLTEENEKTNPKHFHYPNIDALVIEYDFNKTKTFSIINIHTNKEKDLKKRNHKNGIVTWCRDQGERNDLIAFDIIFKESPTKLILRIHFPYKDYKNGLELELLLGGFINVRKQGSIAVGTVLIEKINNEKLPITPYKYRFKIGKEDGFESPKVSIQNYLYDRYKNWIKIPTNKLTFTEFENWQKSKNQKNYTNHSIKIFDYLISYPHSSLENPKDEKSFGESLEKIIENPREALKKSKLFNPEDYDRVSNYISDKFEKGKFRIYPPPASIRDRENNIDINKDFFNELKSSVNVIVIIPKLDYKRITSSYTVIGYCIALQKRTFVFFDSKIKESKRPNIISRTEKNVNLFIHKYENIEDIAFHIINNALKDEWKNDSIRYDSKNLNKNNT